MAKKRYTDPDVWYEQNKERLAAEHAEVQRNMQRLRNEWETRRQMQALREEWDARRETRGMMQQQFSPVQMPSGALQEDSITGDGDPLRQVAQEKWARINGQTMLAEKSQPAAASAADRLPMPEVKPWENVGAGLNVPEAVQTATQKVQGQSTQAQQAQSAQTTQAQKAETAQAQQSKQKVQGQSAQAQQSTQPDRETLKAEADRLREEVRSLETRLAGMNRGLSYGAFTEEQIDEVKAQTEAAKVRQAEADGVLADYDRAQVLQQRRESIDTYELNREDPAFAATAQASRTQTRSRKEDPLGYYIDNKDQLDLQYAMGGTGPEYPYNLMEADEIDMYYYLLAKQGKAAAENYLQDIRIDVDKRSYDILTENVSQMYDSAGAAGKIGMNALAVPAGTMGNFTAPLGDAVSILMQGGYNPYNSGHALTDFSQTVIAKTADEIQNGGRREQVRELAGQAAAEAMQPFPNTRKLREIETQLNAAMEEETGIPWGQIWANTYQGMMSAGQSMLGVSMLGKGYTALMGAGAASQRGRELWENGASDGQIAAGALASGAIEILTEQYSVDSFVDKFMSGSIGGVKDFLKNAVLQGVTEMSEESASNVANLAADALIRGANSNNQQEIREIMAEEGVTRQEAERRAWGNRAVELLWDAYGGLVSGGFMGGVGGATNKAGQIIGEVKAGQDVRRSGGTEQLMADAQRLGVSDQLMQMAREKAESTVGQMHAAAQAWQQARADRAMGQLYGETARASTEQTAPAVREAFRQAAAETIQDNAQEAAENGETTGQAMTQAEAEAAAEAVTKAAYGEELTEAEQQTVEALGGDGIVEQVMSSRSFRAEAQSRMLDDMRIRELRSQESELNPTAVQKNRETVAEAAQEYADPEAVVAVYQDGQDPQAFLRGWHAAYENGSFGLAESFSINSRQTTAMTTAQIKAAHQAGRKAAGYENTENGVLSEGGKWNDRADPRGQIGSVSAESVRQPGGAAEAGGSTGEGAGSTAAAQGLRSTRELGLQNGTENRNLWEVTQAEYTDEDRQAQTEAREAGVKLRIVKGAAIQTVAEVDGVRKLVKSRGLIVGEEAIVRGDDRMFGALQITRHEATHKRIERGEIDVGSVVRTLQETVPAKKIREMVELYSKAYGDSGMNGAEVLEEIICDAMGEMNAFAARSTRSVAGEVGVFLRKVRQAVRQSQGTQQTSQQGAKKTTGDGGVKYARWYANAQTNEEVKRTWDLTWGQKNGILTGEDIAQIDEKLKRIYIGKTKEYKISGRVHAIPLKAGKLVIIHGTFANPVVDIVVEGLGNSKVFSEKIRGAFAYGRKENKLRASLRFLEQFCRTQGVVFYVRRDYRFADWKKRRGSESLTGGVHQDDRSGRTEVKEKFSREIDSDGNRLSKQQAEFFADSKIRDEDGNLRVVYHGTDAEFTVFDRTKSRANMDIQGSFFSPWDMDAEGYGTEVRAYYLNIRNPAPESVGYKALNMFKGQNGAGIKAREYLESMGYDGVNNGDEEYIAFYPEQIKLITNKKPTDNPDIRYSREMDTVAALEQQNKILRQQKEYWKGQARSSNGHRKAEAVEVRRLCRNILSEYSSTTKVSEIADGVQWLADQWADPRADAGYGAMSDYAVELAREIVAGSEVDVNESVADTYAELKAFLRKRYIRMDEHTLADFPDFGDFKKRNRGLHFRTDGTGEGVDTLWLELQDEFGKGVFPDDIMAASDQINHIADTLAGMAPNMQNPYQAQMELTVQQVANDLLWRTSQLAPEKPTRVDAAVERATREMQMLMEQGRQRENRRISEAQDTQQRQRIRKLGEKFRRMVEHPGRADGQHAPAGLAKAAMEICEILNDSELRRMDRWEQTLERRTGALVRRAAGLQGNAPAVMYREFEAIERSQNRQLEIKARFSDLQSRYAAMAGDARFQNTYDETVAGMLGSLAGLLNDTDIGALRGWELRQAANTMQALHHTITNANRAFSMGKNREIGDISQRFAQQMRRGNHAASGIAVIGRRYMMHQMSPDTFFDYLCGFAKDNEGRNIQAAFVRGEEKMLEVQRDFGEFFREFTESQNAAEARELKNLMNYDRKRTVFWGLRDRAGNEVRTTRGMMMQAYMMLQQADSLESLTFGGFSIPNAEAYYGGRQSEAYGDMDMENMMSQSIGSGAMELMEQRKQLLAQMQNVREQLEIAGSEQAARRYQQQADELDDQIRDINRQLKGMTEAAMKRLTGMREGIEEMLTPLERRLIEKAHEWYSHSGELMGDVFEQMYGYRPTLVDNYVPIHRDPSTIKTDIRDMGGADKALNLENSGFTKERIRNYQPILLTDFFTELMSQKGKISRYVGFAQVQKDFGKIWKCRIGHGNDTVATLVRSIFGSGQRGISISGEAYIENYIADIAGGHQSDDILGAFYGNYAAATLRFNPRVALSQAASVPTMAAVVGWKSMGVGMTRGFGKAFSKQFRNELAAKNVFFYQRYKGEGGSTELSDLQQRGNVIEKVANSKYGKALFNWCQTMDVWSTGAMMWYAAEDYVKRSGVQPGSEGYDAEVNRAYTDIIRRSQPNYTVTERSAMLRDKRAHMKLLTMFKTQSNQNLNLLIAANGRLLRAQQDLKHGRNDVTAADVKAAKTEVANAATGVLIGGTAAFVGIRTIMNFIMGMLNPYRDEETNEVTWQATAAGITKEIISSMAGMVSLGGQVYDVANALISGDRFYGLSDSAVTALSGVMEDTITVLQKGGQASEKQIWNMVNSWSMAFGIPANNTRKIYNAIAMYVQGFATGDWKQYTDAGTSAAQYRARVAKYVLTGDEKQAADALAAWFASSTKDTDEETRKAMAQSMRNDYVKNRYISAEITDVEAEKLMRYTGTENPEEYLQKWDFEMENPGESYSAAKARAYYGRGDIPEDILLEAWNFAANAQADKDKNGKAVTGSKKQKIVDHIQGLKLTKQQKKRLFELLDAGSVKGTPWE